MSARHLVMLGIGLLAGSLSEAQPSHEIGSAQLVLLRIEPQPMPKALAALAAQTGVQLIFASGDVAKNLTSPAVNGAYTPQVALRILLASSDLKEEWINDRTVTVGPSLPLHRTRADLMPSGPDEAEKGAQKPGFWERFRVAQVDRGTIADAESVAQSGTPAAKGSGVVLEEIVVTAQKRPERLIDTPQSVSVLSADTLTRLAATQFRDFANTVPGLSFFTSGAGYTQVSLRGVTTGFDVSPTVGVYVDEVPYGSSTPFTGSAYTALDVGLFDVDRIEVLRGPQGTLYGASSLGGLIKYVTRRPDLTQSAGEIRTGISSTQDGGLSYDFAGALNAPLVTDRIALRASAFESHDGGYVDNLALARDDVNRSDIYGGRLDVWLAPSETLNVRLTGFMQNIEREGNGTADFTFGGVPRYDGLEQNRVTPEPFDQRFRLVSATVDYDLGGAALTSISSYQEVRTHQRADQTGLYALFLPGFYGAVNLDSNLSTDKFTQEVRLASDQGRAIEWVAGGFYTHESSGSRPFLHLNDVTGQPLPDFDAGANPTRYDEYAAFGDVTWHPTEKLDVTGGVRFAHQKLSYSQNGLFTKISSTDEVFTYLANVRYHLRDRATLYGRYATGYRPGGANPIALDPSTSLPFGPSTFEADSLRSYEAGFKSESEDRRFAVDLAAHFTDWNNPQIYGVRGIASVLVNVPGGATIRGVELAFTARPVDRLTASGSFSYQDSQLERANLDLGGAAGERLPNVPRYSATASVDYALASTAVQPTLGATVRYVADRDASFDNSVGTPQYHLPSYTLVDLRTGLTFGPVSTQLYIRNAFDRRAQLSAYTIYGSPLVGIAQPRTIGLLATARF